jgi:para-aminobenzoate synthetase
MSPRVKFHWVVVSLFLLNFSSFMTTIESFVVHPFHSNGISVKIGITSTTRSASTTVTKLFQKSGGSSDSSGSMEFRSIPNKPFRDERKYNVSILVIDHYDSFTYNLCDMLAQMTIDPPVVVAKDAIDATAGAMSSFFEKFDGIVLSPGPGTPEEQPPLSHLAITENPDVPIFGVCLGHQLLALAYGATVDRAPVPIHGQDHRIVQKEVEDNDTKRRQSRERLSSPPSRYPSLFQDLPTSFRVVRYHSLCAYDLPENLAVTARSSDDVVQAIQHEFYPHYGVQFHPESIGTENGMKLLENFLRVAEQCKSDISDRKDDSYSVSEAPLESNESPPALSSSTVLSSDSEALSRFRIMVHRIAAPPPYLSSLQVFEKYYARQSHAIWLDSSSSHTGRGELDILAAPSRSDDIIEYHMDDNKSGDGDILSRLEEELFNVGRYSVTSNNIGWVTFKEDEPSLEWIQENDESNAKSSYAENLPFNYRGGFLGFLGYEVRHDTQRYLQQLEGGPLNNNILENDTIGRTKKLDEDGDTEDDCRLPTAAFFLARQSMVYHHPTAEWYLIGLVEEVKDIEENLEWMKKIDTDLRLFTNNDSSKAQTSSASNQRQNLNRPSIEFIPNRPKETYENDIAECHEYIKKGDSYELCLTNQLEARISGTSISTFDLYKIIREVNPAPYSSYFRWNLSSRGSNNHQKAVDEPSSTSLAICSSSPERFMSISRQQPHPEMPSYLQAEAKPIKGTCARVMPKNGVCLSDAEIREDDRRARSLELSLKNRAENLMIVDLLRNDMSRVCKTGSVHVSKLMDIESFATVHQMVSTIRGTLSDSCNAIDLLRASFPGGSMTGAPKKRTMEILQELEEDVDRGPYSGSLGYLSVNGCMDMNIMIRSAVVTPAEKKDEWNVSIGAGGAITALSDAEDEYDEMLLKARAVKEAVERWAATIDNDEIVLDTGATVSNSTDAFVES